MASVLMPSRASILAQVQVVVLSHAFWQRRFQADPSIVGKTITLRGIPFKVVGVTARDFVGTTPDVPSFSGPIDDA